jgi:hypothetical protein
MIDRVFGGSAELLLTQLVEDRTLSADDIKRLRAVIVRQIKQRKQ